MAETTLRDGQQIGRFRVERLLGRGGMGEVYLAFDLDASTPRALKLVPPEYVLASDSRSRLLREARLAQELQHPNIVRIFGLGSADGFDFIVMEYVDGETLEQRLEKGPLDLRTTCRVGVGVSAALAAAHAIGLIHRDIKPSNLMFDVQGRVKVLDFGLARRLPPANVAQAGGPDTLTKLTRTGTIVGTAAYMSPEQSRGEPLDGRSDLFSLGSVLYEMATGRPPFRGESALEVMHEIAIVDPLPAGLIRPELPRAFDEVVSRALAKDPLGRFQSASEMGVALEGVRDEAPRPARGARPSVTSHLPSAPTSFIGRAMERAELRSLLASQRILTITGPGGSGKTRLAVQVAGELSEAFPDGAWFVDLSAIHDPELVGPLIASTLGVRERTGGDALQNVAEFLRTRSLLVVLDNCEQVKTACAAWIGEALRDVPRIRVLATSREPVGVEGEHAWMISPLAVLPVREGTVPRPDDLLRFEAVRLFVERARDANPAFALTADNASLVVEICRQLDGLPLAIELCAARIRVMPLEEIRRRLGDSLRLLTAGGESLPSRQRTLRAAMDWSYELLSGPERSLFRSLSVFAAGASLEAVENIFSDDTAPRDQIVDLISSLSAKSLLVAEGGAGGTPRYRLLETLRQYAKSRLDEQGEGTRLNERFGHYFESLAEKAQPALEGSEQSLWLERLDEEHGNLRTAMDWLAGHGHFERALNIAGSIGRFWWVRGYWREGLRRLEGLLSTARNAPGAASAAVRAKALGCVGRLYRERGDYVAARLAYEENLSLCRELGDSQGASMALANIGITVQTQGDFDRARACFEESLELQRRVGDLRGIAISYNLLGRLADELGDAPSSLRYFEQGLELRRRLGDSRGVAISMVGMGHSALRQGDFATARSYLLQGLAIQRELGDQQGSAYALASLGLGAISSGDLAAARAYLVEALTIVRQIGDDIGQAEALDGLAELAARSSQPKHALRLLGAASAIYESLGTSRNARDAQRIGAWREQVEIEIGPDSAAAEFAAGQAMGPEPAAALALRPTPPGSPVVVGDAPA